MKLLLLELSDQRISSDDAEFQDGKSCGVSFCAIGSPASESTMTQNDSSFQHMRTSNMPGDRMLQSLSNSRSQASIGLYADTWFRRPLLGPKTTLKSFSASP